MIKDTLPSLPEDHFDEVVLYEQYVRDSLKRKASDLQPERRLSEDSLVQNLTAILEELAVRLHTSRTDYINLREFDTGRREGLAEILWEMSGASANKSADSTPDARSRVGIRSLLKPVAGIDPDRWPVDFFHRSMREFFVARALVRAITSQNEQARTILAHVPLQPEVVDFAKLLMRRPGDANAGDTQETLTHKLVSLAKTATMPIYAGQHLGGNALTLLFALNRELPKIDWSDLALDSADLAGADLSGLSFRGSSLRNASLHNTSLVGSDLRDADLTGAQLEQTARVLALTFDPDNNAAYAAYSDRSIRRWTFGVGGRLACTTLAQLELRAESLDLSPYGDLVVTGADSIMFLSALGTDEQWHVISHFRASDAVQALSIRGNQVILRGKDAFGSPLLRRYDPIERKTARIPLTSEGSRVTLLGQAATLTATGDQLLLSAKHNQRAFKVPRLTSMDSREIDDNQVLITLGHEDGAVSLWRLHSPLSQPRLEKVWQHHTHAGAVTDVRLSGMFVLSGGIDRTICLFTLTDSWQTSEPLRLHRTLECAGMKIDRLQGPKESSLLNSLLPRPAPTPADVFSNRRRT